MYAVQNFDAALAIANGKAQETGFRQVIRYDRVRLVWTVRDRNVFDAIADGVGRLARCRAPKVLS